MFSITGALKKQMSFLNGHLIWTAGGSEKSQRLRMDRVRKTRQVLDNLMEDSSGQRDAVKMNELLIIHAISRKYHFN